MAIAIGSEAIASREELLVIRLEAIPIRLADVGGHLFQYKDSGLKFVQRESMRVWLLCFCCPLVAINGCQQFLSLKQLCGSRASRVPT